jgi:hypothetical protein
MPSQGIGCTFGPNCFASVSARATVGEVDALDAAFEQAEHDRARGTAGPEHQCLFRAVPTGRSGIEIADEAFDIGIGRAQLAVGKPKRVRSADGPGTRIGRGQRQHVFLVRDGDVGADEAAQRQPQHEVAQILGRDRLDDVASLDPERAQPVTMDQRRARMRGRPSDQTGCGSPERGHLSLGSCSRPIHFASRRLCQARGRRIAAAAIAAKASAAAAANQIAARLIQA